MDRLNLDANATYGLIPEVTEALRHLPEYTLNPSSIHTGGQRARALIEEARDSVSTLCGASGLADVIFTSGATEANNMAIMSPFWRHLNGSKREASVLTSAVEHLSILEAAARIGELGFSHKVVAHGSNGSFLQNFENTLDDSVVLASVMVANNETGEILPVERIGHTPRRYLLHTDAVQALGKIECNFSKLGVEMMSISAHKIGGLTGVGALVIKRGVEVPSFQLGGPQEKHQRAGTENVVGIYSFGIAAQCALRELERRRLQMTRSCEILRSALRSVKELTVINTDAEKLPNTLLVRLPGVNADDLVVALDLEGISVSSGAACASGKPEPSHVLIALGFTPKEAKECIRISVTGEMSDETSRKAGEVLVTTMRTMQERSPREINEKT